MHYSLVCSRLSHCRLINSHCCDATSEPMPFCARVEHADHSATEPPDYCLELEFVRNSTSLGRICRAPSDSCKLSRRAVPQWMISSSCFVNYAPARPTIFPVDFQFPRTTFTVVYRVKHRRRAASAVGRRPTPHWDVSYSSIVPWVETIRIQHAEGCSPPDGANACSDGYHSNTFIFIHQTGSSVRLTTAITGNLPLVNT